MESVRGSQHDLKLDDISHSPVLWVPGGKSATILDGKDMLGSQGLNMCLKSSSASSVPFVTA